MNNRSSKSQPFLERFYEAASARPMVLFAAALIAGILSSKLEPGAVLCVSVLFLAAACILVFMLHPAGRVCISRDIAIVLIPFFMLTGYITVYDALAESKLRSGIKEECRTHISGQITSINGYNDKYLVYLDNSKAFHENIPLDGNKAIIYTDNVSGLRIGNKIDASGKLYPLRTPGNPGQFDEMMYYSARGVDARVYADEITITDDDYSYIEDFIYRVRSDFTQALLSILPSDKAGIAIAVILGEKSLLDEDIKELYSRSGIAHILSISGLHISLIGLAIYEALRRLSASTGASAVLTILFLIAYGLLTGMSVSTTRAILMLIVMMLARILGRVYDMASALAFTAIITLFINPLMLYDTGFLLSYGAVLGISIVSPLIKRINVIERNKALAMIAMSLGIQIFTLPVLMMTYYEISPYSWLLNLFVLPFASVLIFFSATAGMLTVFSVMIARFFAGPVYYILELYEKLCYVNESIPYHCILTGAPSVLCVIMYYLVLGVTFIVVYISGKPRYLAGLLLCGVIFVIPAGNDACAAFLDVGQGDCTYLRESETTYLIDGGSTSVSSVGRYRIVPFLKYMGESYIDYCVVTHPDSDHINGLQDILENIPKRASGEKRISIAAEYNGYIDIGCLIMPICGADDEACMKLEVLALSKGIEVVYIGEGAVIDSTGIYYPEEQSMLYSKCESEYKSEDNTEKNAGSKTVGLKASENSSKNLRLTCLNPSPDISYSSRNAYSIVLAACSSDLSLLLTGDVTGAGEQNCLSALDSFTGFNILKVAHHGAKSSTSEAFLEKAAPTAGIISCSLSNQYGHPHEELLKRLNAAGVNEYITCRDGAIFVEAAGTKTVTIKSYLHNR